MNTAIGIFALCAIGISIYINDIGISVVDRLKLMSWFLIAAAIAFH